MSFPKNKIIITGEIGVGKSTLVNSLLDEIKVPFSCFQTSAILSNNNVVGFEFGELDKRTRFQFATLVNPELTGPEKYQIDKDVFNKTGVEIIEHLRVQAKLIVLDELGIMELNSLLFLQTISKLFNSNKPVIAIIQQRALEKYIEILMYENYKIFKVTISNRNKLKSILVSSFQTFV